MKLNFRIVSHKSNFMPEDQNLSLITQGSDFQPEDKSKSDLWAGSMILTVSRKNFDMKSKLKFSFPLPSDQWWSSKH